MYRLTARSICGNLIWTKFWRLLAASNLTLLMSRSFCVFPYGEGLQIFIAASAISFWKSSRITRLLIGTTLLIIDRCLSHLIYSISLNLHYFNHFNVFIDRFPQLLLLPIRICTWQVYTYQLLYFYRIRVHIFRCQNLSCDSFPKRWIRCSIL